MNNNNRFLNNHHENQAHLGNTAQHICSYYTRQNSADRSTKDIYNQEHGLSTNEEFNRLPLNSEFKRTVEERETTTLKGGASIFDEIQNSSPNQTNLNVNDNAANQNSSNTAYNNRYQDAKLSCCYKDASKINKGIINSVKDPFGNRERKRGGCEEDEEAGEDQDVFEETGSSQNDVEMEDDVIDEDYDTDATGTSLGNLGYFAQAPDDISVDLDEDVDDVIGKQVELLSNKYCQL